jgi:hypothetical protein
MAEEYEVEIVGGETPSSEPDNKSETPSEKQPQGDTQPEETPAGETPAQELYELPDGRKVDAQTVLEEYKNLQKDYTQKSQKLASYEKKPDIINDNKVDTPSWKDPEWQPQTYAELLEVAKQEMYRDMEEKQRAEQEVELQLANQVDSQLTEVKKLDPNVNESKLLEHATKYKIPDLVSAYNNMKEMNTRIEAVRAETAKNLQKRASDPVAGTQGQETPIDEANIYDPRASTTSLLDYLRQIKQK